MNLIMESTATLMLGILSVTVCEMGMFTALDLWTRVTMLGYFLLSWVFGARPGTVISCCLQCLVSAGLAVRPSDGAFKH